MIGAPRNLGHVRTKDPSSPYSVGYKPAAQPGHITLSRARSRLDRSRFLQPRRHFAAFFEIYKKIIFSRSNFANFCKKNLAKIWQNFQNFEKLWKFLPNCENFFAKNCKISLIFRIFAIFLVKSARIGDFLPNFSWNFVGIAGNIRSFPEIQKICRNLQNYLLQLPKIW